MRSVTHRLHVVLFVLLLACALSVINATYEQRHLFIALDHAQNQAQQLRQEAARLQYQQGALSKTSRIESIALRQLAMEPVQSAHTQYLKRTTLAFTPQPGGGSRVQTASNQTAPVTQQVALSRKQSTPSTPASSQHPHGNKPSASTTPIFSMQIASLARSRGAP